MDHINRYPEWSRYENFLASRKLKVGLSDVSDLKLMDCVQHRVRFGHGQPVSIRSISPVPSRGRRSTKDCITLQPESSGHLSGFDLLPNEIMCKIFGWLDTIDQVPLRKVCRRWKDVLHSRPCMETILICPQTLVTPPVSEECLMFALDKMVDKDQTKILCLYGPRDLLAHKNSLYSFDKEEEMFDSIGDKILNYALGKESKAEDHLADNSVFIKGPLMKQFTVRCLHHSSFQNLRKIALTYGSVGFKTLSELPSSVVEICFEEMDLTGLATLTECGEYGYTVEIKQGSIIAWSEDERVGALWELAEQQAKPLQRKQMLRLSNRLKLCRNFVLSDVLRGVSEIVLRREEELVACEGPIKWDLLTIKPLTSTDINAFVRSKLDALGILGRH